MLRSLTTILFATLALALACPALTNTSPSPGPTGTESAEKNAPENGGGTTRAPKLPADGEKARVMVIDVREAIDAPVLYILRRGLKEAEEKNIHVVILDMKTPGGSAGVAMDMMEALSKFSGRTVTYINDEAMSAGAFISAATDEIWFAPGGVIGAAAAVTSEGQDIPETMRLKINSFLRAKIRATTEGHTYRGEVVSAMIDKDYELIIDGETLKSKGELLSLTATEAMKKYGSPAQPLLGAGIAKNIEDLLQQKYGSSNFEFTRLEVTWSERLAQWLSMIKPLLLGLGMLALFIEFKTPGFGFFGVAGLVLLAIVFLSSYVAGLSGHEPMIVFAVGLILVVVELLFFPGTMILAMSGVAFMLGSLLWAMADIWPSEPISVAWSTDTLLTPFINLILGLLVSFGLGAVVVRFLPKGWIFQRISVTQAVEGAAQIAGLAPEAASQAASLIGAKAIATTALMPSGQVEIQGRRYNARLDMGYAPAGATLRVIRMADFCLIVEEDKSA